MQEIQVALREAQFKQQPRTVVEWDGLSAIAFRYESGVAAVRLANGRGHIDMLPFQGQQVWDAWFDERRLTMKSMFPAPRPTQQYLDTYGGFMLHCGLTGMGVPSELDNHPLHGELPNARYEEATLLLGEDEYGRFIGLTGTYEHVRAFNWNYRFTPRVILHEGTTAIRAAATVTNRMASDLDYMYMAHVNFRPETGGRILYTGDSSARGTRVFVNVPPHLKGTGLKAYKEFLEELAKHPERHTTLTEDLVLDPEVVMAIDYEADREGWARSLHRRPDGTGDFIMHRPDELPRGVRWIARTADQEALGLFLPSTSEHQGYHREKEKGFVPSLAGGESVTFHTVFGSLSQEETREMAAVIENT
jgi:hypothetical protein